MINFWILLSSRGVLDRSALLAGLAKTFAIAADGDGVGARLQRINFVLDDHLQTFGRFAAEHLDYNVIVEGVIVTSGRIDEIGLHLAALSASIDPAPSRLDHSRTRVVITKSCSTPQEDLVKPAAGQAHGQPIKMMAHIHRRSGLSPRKFRKHYEEIHAPLAVRHRRSLLCGYRRNYVVASFRPASDAHPFPNRDADIPDALSEFHFADATAFAGMQKIDPVLGPMIQQDERSLFDVGKVRLFLVDEVSMLGNN